VRSEDCDLTGLEAAVSQRRVRGQGGEAAADNGATFSHGLQRGTRFLLDGTRQQALHEVPLEGEEHGQRNDQ
jgi:hypothetical protein